jgi:hypothetical protein
MTSAPVRDPLADHRLTPQDVALLLIDYQPLQLAGVHSMDRALPVKNGSRGQVKDVADRRLNPDVLSAPPDGEHMAESAAIPGIGPWTVQGALLLAAQCEDVVRPGDLALRKAVQAAYAGPPPCQQEVLAIAEKWRPYRSLATSYLVSAAFEPAEVPLVARLGSA